MDLEIRGCIREDEGSAAVKYRARTLVVLGGITEALRNWRSGRNTVFSTTNHYY